ncbi:MAG: D-alanyl-D-alanine carboxypeptidase family protein, partial [Bdellovibrionales bacterium]
KSANDIVVAVAEHLGGTERNFARQMTQKAHSIGMRNTTFVNASGLHDRRQISTARDMAKLGRYSVYRYPNYYRYFSKTSFSYRGKSYRNHNKLLGHYNGVDGIKTGYVNASGFNLVASAERDGRRIIGVVFGGRSSKSRNDHMVKLLDRGFAKVGRIQTASRQVPKPGIKPNRFPEQTVASNNMKQLNITPQNFEQGDIDPSTSVRFDTGFMALKAHQNRGLEKTTSQKVTPKTHNIVKKVDQQIWGVQIGAFNSRVATETAVKTAKKLLPSDLQYSQNTISPLIGAGSQRIYRARLTGYTRTDAEKVCTYFQECMLVSPSAK